MAGGGGVKLPIRNRTSKPLSLVIEVHATEFEVPVGGEAIVFLEDDRPHSIDVWNDQVTVWNEGEDEAEVEINGPVSAN